MNFKLSGKTILVVNIKFGLFLGHPLSIEVAISLDKNPEAEVSTRAGTLSLTTPSPPSSAPRSCPGAREADSLLLVWGLGRLFVVVFGGSNGKPHGQPGIFLLIALFFSFSSSFFGFVGKPQGQPAHFGVCLFLGVTIVVFGWF